MAVVGPQMNNKRKNIILVFVVGALLVIGLCSGARVATNRKAIISNSEKIIHCRISGFVLFPITPEGAFPHWVNGIDILLNDEVAPPKSGRIEYTAFKDFKTRYDEITAGSVVLDFQNNIVTVNFTYNDTYKFQRVRGDFPIEVKD